MNLKLEYDDYRNWLIELKDRIKTSQIKAALSVNSELISLYWYIGRRITEIQKNSKYGDGIILQLAADLKKEFPDMGGFSPSNLKYCKQFYQFWQHDPLSQQVVGDIQNSSIGQQLVDLSENSQILVNKIPWGHNVLIIQKIKDYKEALFYVQQTIANNWSRSVLQIQIESNLSARQGKAINNFSITLPEPQSDLANQLLKDPYNFNFLTLEKNVQELELERQLVKNITQFLLELGKGFAYMGRQYLLKVGNKEFKLDLLFYHVRLKCYIVIDLKTKEFEPEHIGKLNFYLSAIDAQVRTNEDAPTIGMILCKNKDNLIVEFALRDVNKPIGVSEFTFNELPQQIQNAMPTVEELEKEIFKDEF